MKKRILALASVVAALCACDKQQPIESEIANPAVESSAAPLVFTATMEGAPDTKVTFDNTAQCASWEVGDQISINGLSYAAKTAGTSTTFSPVVDAEEIRPTFVSSTNTGSYQNQPAQNLVDDRGVDTRWIANKTDMVDGVWNIVVATDKITQLKSIKLWNADNSSYPGRRWKSMKVYGSASSDGEWTEIKSFSDLNLEKNNKGLAGEIAINATYGYKYYRIDVLDNEGDNFMQMSDMKFVVTTTTNPPYKAYFPASLVKNSKTYLPSEITETWVDGKFNMPMYAYSENTELQFNNLCGVLKIIVKKDQMESVKSIYITSDNCAISGEFIINSSNAAVLKDPEWIPNAVTVTYTNAVPTTEEGTAFYVAIPAQTYKRLKILLRAGDNTAKSSTTKRGVDINVERNKIYPITFVASVPASGKAMATIDGSQVEVSWVQMWAEGAKFATFNVGAPHRRNYEYGGYYSWGGCQDKKEDYYTGPGNLPSDHDTATKLWGENWRMPTQLEFSEIVRNCKVEWTTVNNINGVRITGQDVFSGNSIFLPAGGNYFRRNFNDKNMVGYYWTSSRPWFAAYLNFYEPPYAEYFPDNFYVSTDYNYIDLGMQVRPVLAE